MKLKRRRRVATEGFGLVVRIAKEVDGLVLAHAFVITKSAGLQLNVNKLDGISLNASQPARLGIVNVDVLDGKVQKSWPSQLT